MSRPIGARMSKRMTVGGAGFLRAGVMVPGITWDLLAACYFLAMLEPIEVWQNSFQSWMWTSLVSLHVTRSFMAEVLEQVATRRESFGILSPNVKMQ